MNNIQDFKQSYDRFLKALRYIINNEATLKQDEKRWAKIKQNFELKFEKPMDEIWKSLTAEEQKHLAPIYLHQKALQNETVKRVIDVFDAKIKSIEEENESSSN